MDAMQNAIQEFIAESHEGLEQYEQDLTALEHDTADAEALVRMFRVIHTITGSSGCFGFLNVESVTNIGERLLGRLRDGQLPLHMEMFSGLRALAEAVRQMLATIQDSGDDGESDCTALIERLNNLLEGQISTDVSASPEPIEAPENTEQFQWAEWSEAGESFDVDPTEASPEQGDAGLDVIQSGVQDFLVECYEGLDRLDRDLAALEYDITDPGPVNSMCGIIHAMAESSGCFGFLNLESLSQAGKNLLVQLRDGQLQASAEIIENLRALAAGIHQLLVAIQDAGDDSDVDCIALMEQLNCPQEMPMSTETAEPSLWLEDLEDDTSAHLDSEPSGYESSRAGHDAMQSAIQEFLIESSEALDQLDRDLVALEQDASNPDLLSSVFRIIHTIKGSSGCFGFFNLESVAHVGENLLSLLRDGQLYLHSEMISGLLGLADAVRQMLAAIQDRGDDGDAEYTELIDTLTRLQAEPEPAGIATEAGIDQLEPDAETLSVSAETTDDQSLETQSEARSAAVNDNTIRVDITLLDKLMNQVGELVLTRNQIM